MKDGWTVTHDPYTLTAGVRHVFVDMGAERLLAAERGSEKIAVEVKVFPGPSDVADLEMALGQYVLYRSLLSLREPDRPLIYETLLAEPIAQPVLHDLKLEMVTFDPGKECFIQWIP